MKMIFGVILFFSSLAQAEIMSRNGIISINANQAMQKCRDSYKNSGNPKGVVVVNFTLDKEGEVTEYGIDDKKSTISDAKLHACIMKSLPARFLTDVNGKERILTATLDFP